MSPRASSSQTSARRSAADMRSGGNGFGRWIGREGVEVTTTLRRLEIVLGFPGSGLH
jgi:hypothetical protein